MADLPVLKIFEMDYSFLMKNYLNPELWNKTWTLFEYKTFRVTLNIYSINTKHEKITFEVRTHFINPDCETGDCTTEYDIICSLKIEDIDFLKRQINSAIYNTMVEMEKRYFIQETTEYKQMVEDYSREKILLRQYANEFLDNAGVTNENLRTAYSDAYVEEYAKMPELVSEYVQSQVYLQIPDLFLTFLSTLDNDPKKEIRTKEIQEKLGDAKYQKILKQIQDYAIYMGTEEYEDEMKSNLEEV